MGFSRQEYWSGLPFPSPGDLPDPGIEPRSPALQAEALLPEPSGKLRDEIIKRETGPPKNKRSIKKMPYKTKMVRITPNMIMGTSRIDDLRVILSPRGYLTMSGDHLL